MFVLEVKQNTYVNAYDSTTKQDLGDESGEYELQPGSYPIREFDVDINQVYCMTIIKDNKLIQIEFCDDCEDDDSLTNYLEIKYLKGGKQCLE